jgi:glutathione S-transferase
MLQLYYAPGSCALASHITLAEAGAEYEAVPLDLLANHQRKPEYLALNPKERVPALVTDKGVLTENPASLAFVAQSFPGARLLFRGDPKLDALDHCRAEAHDKELLSLAQESTSSRQRWPSA